MTSQALLRTAVRRALLNSNNSSSCVTQYNKMLSRSSRLPHAAAPISVSNRFKSSVAAVEDQHEKETFLTGTSSIYAEQMFENYQRDPMSVHPTWRKYFDDMEGGIAYDESFYNRPTVVIPSQKQSGTVVEANQSHLAVSYISFHENTTINNIV